MNEKTKLAIRGWKANELAFEERVELSEAEIEGLVPRLAEKHARLLADAPHMIEIEFLDELDPEQRFFRFGTDPRRMVAPLQVQLFETAPLPE